MQMIQSIIYSNTVYGVCNKNCEYIELWSKVPVWSDDFGWLGDGFVGVVTNGDILEGCRDIVAEGKVYEFKAEICLVGEVTKCK